MVSILEKYLFLQIQIVHFIESFFCLCCKIQVPKVFCIIYWILCNCRETLSLCITNHDTNGIIRGEVFNFVTLGTWAFIITLLFSF